MFEHTDVMDEVIAVTSSVSFSASPSRFYFTSLVFSFYISVKVNSAAFRSSLMKITKSDYCCHA